MSQGHPPENPSSVPDLVDQRMVTFKVGFDKVVAFMAERLLQLEGCTTQCQVDTEKGMLTYTVKYKTIKQLRAEQKR